jgi:hypothetical protein
VVVNVVVAGDRQPELLEVSGVLRAGGGHPHPPDGVQQPVPAGGEDAAGGGREEGPAVAADE